MKTILSMALPVLIRTIVRCYNSLKISAIKHHYINNSLIKGFPVRCISLGRVATCEATTDVESTNDKKRDPKIDRTVTVPVETSIRYLKSEAYKTTYGKDPVWMLYRRNHKGAFPPKKTRKTCIRNGLISTGNPCPICRDEYLVLDYENVELLKQFICPHIGRVLLPIKTGLCQRKHRQLLIALEKAKDYGYITFDVPFRQYDYSLYYKPQP